MARWRQHRNSVALKNRIAVTLVAALGAVLATSCVPRPPTFFPPSPDLVVSSIGDPPPDGTGVPSFSVPVSTRNVAADSSGPSVTRLFLSLDTALGADDAVLGEVNVPGLAPGSAPHVAAVGATVPGSVPAGTYYLLACADATRHIDERNEVNNCRASGGTISFGATPPPPGTDSSQALIERDRAAGLIDDGTALVYRAWALFWDSRLPARYDGTGSTGEDEALFPAIESALPGLPPQQQTELAGYLVRPTDPRSPFGPVPAGAAPNASGAPNATAAAAAPTPTKCAAPKQWFPMDTSGPADVGFRAWVCDVSAAAAAPRLTVATTVGAKVWNTMTIAEPNGMGLPVPDTTGPDNGGNGKIDVYFLTTNQCRERNGACAAIPGYALAATRKILPCNAVGRTVVPGFPVRACAAEILMASTALVDPTGAYTELRRVLVHEFFHALQYGHNFDGSYYAAGRTFHWYVEASAKWAEWYYSPSLGFPRTVAYGFFQGFQENSESFLEERRLNKGAQIHTYESWVWPLFQTTERGASNVFTTWSAAESASKVEDLDAALAGQLPYVDAFRNFAVRMAQPKEYRPPASTGLEPDWWRTKPGLGDAPLDAPATTAEHTLGLGGGHGTKVSVPAGVFPLSAWYDRYQITDPKVRQITIDLRALTNVASADLDVIGRLTPVANGPRDPWHRVRVTGHTVTLCRDLPTENFNLFYVVLSNHAATRKENHPDFAAAVGSHDSVVENYTVQTKDACAAPDHYDVNFHGFSVVGDTWTGSATFDLVGAARSCDDPAHFPPTTDDVRYCYTLRNGAADWQYTDPQGGTSSTSVVLSPSTDVGTIELRVRSADPQKVRTYYANILPGTLQHLMPTAGGSRDAADKVIAWVATYADGSGILRIGDGYQFAGSARLCAGADCQGWTWDFTPRWDPTSP